MKGDVLRLFGYKEVLADSQPWPQRRVGADAEWAGRCCRTADSVVGAGQWTLKSEAGGHTQRLFETLYFCPDCWTCSLCVGTLSGTGGLQMIGTHMTQIYPT